MNIVLVTNDSVFGRYFSCTLTRLCQIDRVFIETRHASPRFYWRKFRRVGPVNFGFQYVLNHWFEHEGAKSLPPTRLPTHETISSINEIPLTADDLVIAFGTSYVKSRTIASTPHGILNLHTGVLPQYRGVKSEFWALYNRDFSNIGWTLHFMTSRLDAGDIVLHDVIPWNQTNPAIVRATLLAQATPQIAAFLTRYRESQGASLIRTVQSRGQYYSTPTLTEWLAARSVWQSQSTIRSGEET